MSHSADKTVSLSEQQITVMRELINEAQAQGALQGAVAGESMTMKAGGATDLQSIMQQTSPFLAAWKQQFDPASPVLGIQGGPAETPPTPPPPPPPPPLPSQIGPFDTGSITFNNGIPVGGYASLTLFQDGTYTFSGHFHVSGAPSYNFEFGWVIVNAGGKAFTFAKGGHLAGTFESGSRDSDWTQSGQNNDIAAGWADLVRGNNWRWQAYVNWDVAAAVNELVSALKTAGTVITAVVQVVALF